MDTRMKPLVLLSGGLDSAVALAATIDSMEEGDTVKALCFDYGQRHHWEVKQAIEIAKHYDVEIEAFLLPPGIFGSEGIMATSTMPQQVKEGERFPDTNRKDTIVPFRNGVLFSIAVAQAIRRDCDQVVVGTHAARHVDDNAFPDCKASFLGPFSEAVFRGSGDKVMLSAPLQERTKTEIVAYGAVLGVPYALTRSCFVSEHPCGQCLECHARRTAFNEAGLHDPLNYEEDVPDSDGWA